MKKRVFYVINLDRSRILVLSVLVTGFMLIAFATGYRFGSSSEPRRDLGAQEVFMDPARQGLDRSIASPENSLAQPDAKPDAKPADKPLADPQPARRDREEPSEVKPRAQEKKPEARPQVRPNRAAPHRETAQKSEDKKEKADKRNPEKPARVSDRARSEKPAPAKPVKENRDRAAKTESKPNPQAKKDQKDRSSAVLEPEHSMRMSDAAPAQNRSFQLGSFSSKDAASRMTDSLKKQGFSPSIVQAGGKYMVRVGNSSRDDLAQLEKQLRAKNYSPVRVAAP